MTGAVVELTFVSSNPGKAREVRLILAAYGVGVRWRRRQLPELQASSLEAVALHKLQASRVGRGLVLVEDSGLFIKSLGGFPGVYSAHFLKLWGFPPIFELLERRPRTAAFRTVAALSDGHQSWTFTGEVRGAISKRPRGRNGFGYDPIFIPKGERRTFGEMSLGEKERLSHRGAALRKVGRFLVPKSSPSHRPRRRAGQRVRRPR